MERLDAIRREIARIAEILERLGEMVREETYETVDYIGPARMIDLRARALARAQGATRGSPGCASWSSTTTSASRARSRRSSRPTAAASITASDGLEALERLAAQPFDVVLSDVVMPNMDGYELFLTVREQPARAARC